MRPTRLTLEKRVVPYSKHHVIKNGGITIMKKMFYTEMLLILCCIINMNIAWAADNLVILLDWFANPGHAPLFVAKTHGFFKAENLNVTLLGPADPADPPKLVAAGKADIAITYEPHLFEQVARGLPLVRMGTLIDKPLSCLAVLRNGPIYTITDLTHKRIGYSGGDVTHLTLKTMLERNHLTLHEVQPINVHYNLTQALLSKQVDAITGVMRTFEVIQLDLLGQPARIFLPEKNGIPTYSELIFVVNKTHQQDPRLPRFLSALKQAVMYLKKHPEETWNDFAKTHPELNNELNHKAWYASLPYFADDPASFNPSEWQRFGEFMQKNGLIKTLKPLEEYAIILNSRAN